MKKCLTALGAAAAGLAMLTAVGCGIGNVSGGGENPDEIATGYEVTGSQWKKALSVDRLNNVTVRLSLGKDIVTDIFIDGNVSYTKTDDESESWYVVRNEDCAYEYVLNDDEWMRKNIRWIRKLCGINF